MKEALEKLKRAKIETIEKWKGEIEKGRHSSPRAVQPSGRAGSRLRSR